MKLFTDIEQSKKLAEILPLESADIVLVYSAFEDDYFPHFRGFGKIVTGAKDIKAWSLAALTEVLPNYIQNKCVDYYTIICDDGISASDYSLTDACVKLIERLAKEGRLKVKEDKK